MCVGGLVMARAAVGLGEILAWKLCPESGERASWEGDGNLSHPGCLGEIVVGTNVITVISDD